jgi:hypothetical protein
MNKKPVARQELERMAMQEIRAYPGCDPISVVEIEYAVDEISGVNWIMHVFTREGANMERIQYAINQTRSGCGIGTACEQSPNGHAP